MSEQANSDTDRPRGGLLTACLRGEDAAWEQLVRGHAGLVYGVIRRCGLEGQEADDLFHKVWLTAWERLATLPDEGQLKAGLVTLAVKEVSRTLARRRTA